MRRLPFRTIHDVALMPDREREAREQSPSAAVVDSQSVKAPSAPSGGGYDAGKRIRGRKRHIAVDTDGRLLMVNLTTADISDSAGAQEIVSAIRRRWPWLEHLFGDGAHDRTKLLDAAALRDFNRRDHPAVERRLRLQGASPTLGRRTRFRLDDTLTRAGSGL